MIRQFHVKFDANEPFDSGTIIVGAEDIEKAMALVRANCPVKRFTYISDMMG